MTDEQKFASRARELLGERGFTCDPDLLEPWLTDWRGRYSGAALGMASPASTEEVAAFVRLCAEYGVPVVPQGGNSGMSGGATPDQSGHCVLLSLRRMDRIRSLDPAARQVVCEAGVVLQNLHEAVEKQDLRFPLSLGGKGSATVGGLISTNAGGTQVLRHGTMRAQVLGLEAVLADGRIFNGLTALKKDNRGFDLKQLLIGSEGTLGIVTAANLRLAPAIGSRVVAWIGMRSIQQARELLLLFERELPDQLEGFEVIPSHCLDSVLALLPDARAPLAAQHGWNVLVELVAPRGADEGLREAMEGVLAAALDAGLIEDAVIAASEKQADDLWQLREMIAPAERAIGPAMQHDISVPVERMADFVEAAIPMVEHEFPGVTGVGFGHLGDGNLHFHVLAPKDATAGEWDEQEGKQISCFVHNLVTEWGGSISAEHGIGQMKRDELGRLGDPVALSIMRQVKRALDPAGLLNPGKLVPLAPEGTSL